MTSVKRSNKGNRGEKSPRCGVGGDKPHVHEARRIAAILKLQQQIGILCERPVQLQGYLQGLGSATNQNHPSFTPIFVEFMDERALPPTKEGFLT